MSRQISYKNALKASLLAIFVLVIFFALLIWIFGDNISLSTEIRPSTTGPSFEKLESVSNPVASNLTSDISAVLAQEILAKNPSGPQIDGITGQSQIEAIDPTQLVAQTIKEGLKNFNPEELREKVDLANFKTSPDNSETAQARYFTAINKLIKDQFQNLSINYTDPEATNFLAIAKGYENVSDKLYALAVPEVVSHFHLKLIELMASQRNVYAAISNYKKDPLQALLVLDFGDVIGGEIVKLFNEMNAYLDNNEIELN